MSIKILQLCLVLAVWLYFHSRPVFTFFTVLDLNFTDDDDDGPKRLKHSQF